MFINIFQVIEDLPGGTGDFREQCRLYPLSRGKFSTVEHEPGFGFFLGFNEAAANQE